LESFVGINLFFYRLPPFFDSKRRKGLFYTMVVTKRARQDTGRLLLLEGGAVPEPALKFVTIRAKKIKSNHQKMNNMFLFFWQGKTRRLLVTRQLRGMNPADPPGMPSKIL
jgi:hypothetical protein